MDWTELANKHRRGDGLPKMIREPSPSDSDFDGVTGREYPLTYDDAGSLTSDAGRKIARIEYDCRNNPVRISSLTAM